MPAVLFVCLGNICRSPMAEGILRARVAGRPGWTIDSAGTAGHHAGESADPRTVAVLRRHGHEFPHRARAVTQDDYRTYDVLLAMDEDNLTDLRRRCPAEHHHKLHLVREPTGGGEVPDPYYGGPDGFAHVHQLLSDAIDGWLARWG